MTAQCIQQDAICYQWFKQRLILSISKPSISQRSQIKEDTIEPSVPAREFNLKAYAAITWHNDAANLGLKPRLADHCNQAARTAMLPVAPPGQARLTLASYQKCCQCNSDHIISPQQRISSFTMTTAVVWCQVEREATLIFEHIFYLKWDGHLEEDLNTATEAAVPTSI